MQQMNSVDDFEMSVTQGMSGMPWLRLESLINETLFLKYVHKPPRKRNDVRIL